MRQGSRKIRRWLRPVFILLGPVSVAAYLLVHVWGSLAGACWHLVVEATLEPLLRRPIRVSSPVFYLLSPVLLLACPFVAAGHALVASGRGVCRLLIGTGRWQAGCRNPATAFVVGGLWLAAFTWAVIACVAPRSGWRLLGRDLPGLEYFENARDMRMTLGELPEPMQRRRGVLLSGLRQARRLLVGVRLKETDWLALADILRDDQAFFVELPRAVQKALAGLPWYYEVPQYEWELRGRCVPLLGPLLLLVALAVRWWGLGFLARGGAVGLLQAFVRNGVALGFVAWAFAGDSPDAARKAGIAGEVIGAGLLLAFSWWLAWRLSGYWRLPRQYSAFLALRLLQRKRIAFFSVGAVTLCVAMVLIVVSVMGGFLDMVRERSHRLLGDLVMDNATLQGFPFYDEFIERITKWPEVEAATPLIYTYGLLRLPDGVTKPVQVVGIRLEGQDRVTDFRNLLFYEQWYPGTTTFAEQGQPVYGFDSSGRPVLPAELEVALQRSERWRDLRKDSKRAKRYARLPGRPFPGPGVYAMNEQDPSRPDWLKPLLPGIIIGRDIIAQRTSTGEYYRRWSYPRGCKVTLTLVPLTRKTATVSATGPLTKAFRYVDDSRTGIYEIDSQYVYVDFDLLQELLEMGRLRRAEEAGGGFLRPRCSQIQIRVAPGYDLQAVKEKLRKAWQEMLSLADDPFDRQLMTWVDVQTWEERQRPFISAVEKEKVLMLILFGVISLVAVFLILCIFYMIVMEKTRDIGIIKSVGGSSGGVAAIFLGYGAAIGVVGATLGLVIGTLFVRYINQIQDWLASIHPELRVWKADVYSFDYIPNTVKVSDATVIAMVAILAAIAGAVVPAVMAARKHPVEAIRYE